MSIHQAKEILHQFDRVGLEMSEGLDLLMNHGIISDLVVEFRDIAMADAERAVEFLKVQNP